MTQVSEGLMFFIRYVHPEKTMFRMPDVQDLDESQLCATLFGMDPGRYFELKERYQEQARRAAQDLLSQEDFADAVDRLPFEPGSLVVGLGDSITDDLISWLEILKQVLAIHRPDDNLRVQNAGVSGETTTHLLSRFSDVAAMNPDWIICMAGTNDARRHGLQPIKSMVSIEETYKNLAALTAFARSQTKANWVWITPPPIIQNRADKDRYFESIQVSWLAEEVKAVIAAVRSQAGMVVDLELVFGESPQSEYYIQDGLHPSLAGQKRILEALVKRLADG